MNITNSIQGQRIYPQQIQNDIFATNVLVSCDPRLKGPPPTKNELILNTKASVFGNPLNQENESGKLAVGEEICDLTINGNLEVKGKLKLNGSIVNELLQGVLTTPLQVNIDANNKNITGAANIGVGRVDTSLIVGAAGTLMSIRPNGIPTSTFGQRAQNLQIGNAEDPGDVIIETGGISGNNTVGQLSLQCTQQDLPGQYNINIGADMGSGPFTGLKFQFINIGTVNSSGANLVNNIHIGNTASSNLQFFSTTNVIDISTSGGTKPSTLAGTGLDKATIDTANPSLADITQILQDYGLIQ